jgi:protein-tyrosine phosphatase
MQQLHDQVWIADISDARTESTARFDRVITVCQDHIADNVSGPYEWYNMNDGSGNAYGGDDSYALFEQAATSLLRALQDGETVLVHCHMGQSRSASVIVAAIAVLEQEDFETTFMDVKEQRSVVNPDTQLRRYARRFIDDR